jgi:sulfur carrier protein
MTAAAERIPVRVNGETREVPAGTTVSALLTELGLPAATVAVERNREILPKPRYAETVLGPEDSLEIVRFVGGG